MRKIPNDILALLHQGEKFVYRFKFVAEDHTFYLTSNDDPIILDDNIYLQYSGLTFEKAAFNDSAQNYVEISGIFEEGGINVDDELSRYLVECIIYFQERNVKHSLSTYLCSKLIRDGLKFTLYLEPLANKLKQTLIDNFSLTCRAQLGDSRCGVDKSTYPAETNCDKSFRTCCNKFNNAVNFRGEPFIPMVS